MSLDLLPIIDGMDALEDAIEHMNRAAGMLLFCVVAVAGSLLFVPAWIFPLVAGAVFGLGWGLVAALVSASLSAIAGFLIARYVLRAWFGRLARRSKTFKAVDHAVAKDAWKVVALVRMSPVLPSSLKSYFLGLTRVRLPDYVGASVAGMLPGVLLKVYVGSAGRNALSHGSALHWAIFAAGIVATIALTVIVGREVRSRLEL